MTQRIAGQCRITTGTQTPAKHSARVPVHHYREIAPLAGYLEVGLALERLKRFKRHLVFVQLVFDQPPPSTIG